MTSVCVCVCVCVWEYGGSSKLTFNFPNLYSTPILPANFLTLLFFFPSQYGFYAALSDNTLEAILELISLIGNKLQLFLQLQTAFLSCSKQRVGPGKWKERKRRLPRIPPSPSCTDVWRNNNYCWGGWWVSSPQKVPPAPKESISSPLI